QLLVRQRTMLSNAIRGIWPNSASSRPRAAMARLSCCRLLAMWRTIAFRRLLGSIPDAQRRGLIHRQAHPCLPPIMGTEPTARAGPAMADLTLRYLRKVLNWHAARTEFRSPIVRGMARINPAERARDRILTDDELRKVWRAAGDLQNAFGLFTR